VFALLMLVLLAAACARGVAVPPPLMPRWRELSQEAGGGVGAALVLASTAPIILSCFTCHQVRAKGLTAAGIATWTRLHCPSRPARHSTRAGLRAARRSARITPAPRRSAAASPPPQSLHPLLPSLRPYSTRRAQAVAATSLAAAGALYFVISL
jgi:hypothetical protein